MKYLYQQMLAFFSVIMIVILIVGVSFWSFTKGTMEKNAYSILTGYAEAVQSKIGDFKASGISIDGSSSTSTISTETSISLAFSSTASVLSTQNITLYYVDSKSKEVKYPANYSDSEKLVKESDWLIINMGGKIQDTRTIKIDGKKQVVAIAIVPSYTWPKQDGEAVGAVVGVQPLENIEENLSQVLSNLIRGFIISAFVAMFICYYLAKFQVNRINRIRSATKEVASGNFDVHFNFKGNDEINDLANDFSMMTKALKESHDEIERQEELRKKFMADVAHEMRTPLTTINGLLEGLAYDAIPDNQKKKSISLMQNETKRLIRLVNENLDYEKIRMNQITLSIQQLDATKIMQSLVEQLKGKAENANDELILLTNEPVMIYADYDRLSQILVNIITNSIQFTRNGVISLSAERGFRETVLVVEDTGIGMNEEEMTNMWTRYYKADPSRKNTKYGESGLGLSIVQQLIKLHQGTVSVKSEIGKGTIFTIVIPDSEEKATD